MIRKINIKKTNDPRYRHPWLVRWREPAGIRKYHHRQRCFPTKTQAEEFAKNLWGRLNADDFGKVIAIGWQDFVELFLAAKKGDRLAKASLKIYRQILNEFGQVTNNPQLSEITIEYIDLFKKHYDNDRRRRQITAVTLNTKLHHLAAAFNWAVERNYMRKNPIGRGCYARERKHVKTVWTPGQFKKFMEVVDNEQWKVLIHLAINGVGRKASLMALTVGDIDFSDGTVKCYDAKQKTERITPIHPASMRILTRYVNELPAGQTKLFTSAFHHRTWTRWLHLAKVPHVTFHGLRVCMSTWLKQAGVNSEVVTDIFGHSSIQMTHDHYTALDSVETKRKALNQLPLDD